MKRIYYILMLLAFAFSSCETILDLDTSDANDDYCVSAAVTAGDSISIYISKTMSNFEYDAENIVSTTYEIDWRRALFAWLFGATQKTDIVKDADVSITVGGREYSMHYDAAGYSYTCDYIPQEGDVIGLKINAGAKTLTSECIVPTPTGIEISEARKVYDSDNSHQSTATTPAGLVTDQNAIDSVLKFNLKISALGSIGYYRLVVRSVGYDGDGSDGYYVSDIFKSDDDFFYDESITSAFCQWDINFTNIFSLAQVRNNVAISSRIRQGEHRFIMVELQTLTRDLYNYLKTIETYRISADDEFANPICLKTNVNDGFGVFGGVACDRKIITID